MKKKVASTLILSAIILAVMMFASNFVGTMYVGNTFAAETEEKFYTSDVMPIGGTITDYVTETVSYGRAIPTGYENPYKIPLYYATEIDNSCAVTAGGSTIGYYDRIYEELIPNHTGTIFMGHFTYGAQDAEVNSMFRSLAFRMGTTESGTTIPGYISGMDSYIKSKGRVASIESVCDNGTLNDSEYETALENGKLLTLFVDGFCFTEFSAANETNDTVTIRNTVVTGCHTLTAYGYRTYSYYDSSNRLIRQDKYMLVHTGFNSIGRGLLRLTGGYCTIDDGFIIDIN